ncbi:MAG: FAD-dependent oxidoreductase [Candidatus Omnitrophica bacterium]|nr:FAD-dependent oxidoreductase [Candidatus Omnitrophota bacterium]
MSTQNTVQPAEKRIRTFNEVSLGYSKRLVLEEAQRCPQCSNPECMKERGCPLGILIPGFIRFLREGHLQQSYLEISERNCFPAICGRICSAPCEKACILAKDGNPIAIRALERFSSDFGKTRSKKEPKNRNGKKVAIAGAGPAGLTAAWQLALKGYQVTVFESMDKPGGVLRYGVPEFRLPKRILDGEINDIKALGVEIRTNFLVGKTAAIEDLLKEGYQAVLLATGAGITKFMELPGANLTGVYYGEEFLMRVNLMKMNIFSQNIPAFPIGKKIAVVGSGNTALDCARAAVRLNREVTLIFRRTQEEMRVRQEDCEYGKEEGVKLEPLTRPVEVLSDAQNRVGGLKCIRMDYADVSGDGTWDLLPVPDSEFVLDVDTVILAIGHRPNSLIAKSESKLMLNDNETVYVDPVTRMTPIPGVFAAGNVVTNAGPLVSAMASGIKAAQNIDNYLKS